MSISQHEDNLIDYMDDFQAIAWILLEFLNFNLNTVNDCYIFKNEFVNNYKNKKFINRIIEINQIFIRCFLFKCF